ncbi:MAG: dTDP-4-dehydrorhamnose 3,5-epimerase family protein [Acidobacteria bacterium]|nr:dTDP-4-dehydrorhamnose 3,5-epimerase family protein [Acidobacteriota bacterium]
MKILEVKALAIPDIKVVRFGRFPDHRGYFGEHFRKSDFNTHPQMEFLRGVDFFQCNESYSKNRTIRGLHFQWNPYMGKLVRTLSGRMTDLVLDIRKGSPTFGKIIAYDLPAAKDADFGEWIWIPPGFAHGNYFCEDSHIEYFCSGEYSPGCEAGISPLASDLDWSMCNSKLRKEFDSISNDNPLMTDKDRNGHSLASWISSPNSDHFIFR